MRNLLIICSVLVVAFTSCKPSIQPQEMPQTSWADTTTYTEVEDDSIPSFEVNTSADPIIVTIENGQVIIKSGNVNTVYNVEVDRIFVKRSEAGFIEYVQVNDDILFKENVRGHVNHTYRYLDNNQIEILSGNTILGIIGDHKISKKQLYRCNPFLNRRGLQIGDVINLDCN